MPRKKASPKEEQPKAVTPAPEVEALEAAPAPPAAPEVPPAPSAPPLEPETILATARRRLNRRRRRAPTDSRPS